LIRYITLSLYEARLYGGFVSYIPFTKKLSRLPITERAYSLFIATIDLKSVKGSVRHFR
jgi:hypothetical protein